MHKCSVIIMSLFKLEKSTFFEIATYVLINDLFILKNKNTKGKLFESSTKYMTK